MQPRVTFPHLTILEDAAQKLNWIETQMNELNANGQIYLTYVKNFPSISMGSTTEKGFIKKLRTAGIAVVQRKVES